MKALQLLLIAVVAAFAFSACGEEKSTNDIIAKQPVPKAPSGPVKMQDSKYMENVKWDGKDCSVSIMRHADTSLPVITDDTGAKYYDNVIDVAIITGGGQPIFKKTFNKQDFASQVTEKYLERSALLGIVFDHIEGNHIVFAASVGHPDVLSDDQVPMLITVSQSGQMSLSKDTRFDSAVQG